MKHLSGSLATETGVVSGYQFLALARPGLVRARAEARAARLGLCGTVLVAAEGINFSLFGACARLDEWLAWLRDALRVDQPVINRQPVARAPFRRLRVRVREEIVTFDPGVRPPAGRCAGRLTPAEWNRLLARGDVQLVDVRNDYEVRLGTFDGALDPGTTSFTEFKRYCETALDRSRPVAMFCTGGVRCEKAGAWLLQRGQAEVWQLSGGILGYLAQTAPEQSRWRGECFVFDDRVSVDANLRSTGRVVCRACRRPADGVDAAGLPPVTRGRECGLCGERFDAARLAGLLERSRQVALAAGRGGSHLGPGAQS